MIQSAFLMTSMLCSMTITVLPVSTRRLMTRQQMADIRHVQAGGRLVHDVDAALFVQFAGELDALAFAARKRAQRLTERQIVQPHIAHGLQFAHDFLECRKTRAPGRTFIASTSLMDLPLSLYASTSSLNRLPPQISQGDFTLVEKGQVGVDHAQSLAVFAGAFRVEAEQSGPAPCSPWQRPCGHRP